MRRISPLARIVLVSAGVVGLLAYLAIVELGVNAGLVHRGVKVGHIDVGGLSQAEAAEKIAEVGEEIRATPIRLAIEGVATIFVYPRDLGWKPRAVHKAEAAMAIGREGGLPAAASDRVSAWFGDHRIAWDEPRPRPLRRGIRSVVRAARTAGVEVSWNAVRTTLIEATYDWPRRDAYEVPAVGPAP
jgi:hypothetical protein